MQIIKWANGKGQKFILSEGEYEELCEALSQAGKTRRIDTETSKGECGRFEIEIEH
mgnify:CR=1 FL=1